MVVGVGEHPAEADVLARHLAAKPSATSHSRRTSGSGSCSQCSSSSVPMTFWAGPTASMARRRTSGAGIAQQRQRGLLQVDAGVQGELRGPQAVLGGGDRSGRPGPGRGRGQATPRPRALQQGGGQVQGRGPHLGVSGAGRLGQDADQCPGHVCWAAICRFDPCSQPPRNCRTSRCPAGPRCRKVSASRRASSSPLGLSAPQRRTRASRAARALTAGPIVAGEQADQPRQGGPIESRHTLGPAVAFRRRRPGAGRGGSTSSAGARVPATGRPASRRRATTPIPR